LSRAGKLIGKLLQGLCNGMLHASANYCAS
jgi:hypothetical protein